MKLVCLDVPTQWNSTLLMLEATEKFENAFDRLEEQDAQYIREFFVGGNKRAPNYEDWEVARAFIRFLRTFYEATLKFSCSFICYFKFVFA